MRTVSFYDNLEATASQEDPSLVEVERIYCLDCGRFSAADRESLDRIYRTLPGGYREGQGPMWFGDSEGTPPFLWASVEPPGVQVYGLLPLAAWLDWHRAFMAALGTSSLPFRP